MKKLISILLAAALVLTAVSAMAATEIDGKADRNIEIKTAGLNDDAATCIQNGYSPTTGRKLAEIEVPDGFLGTAVTGQYTPFMVQIANADNGIGQSKTNGKLYRNAPVNAIYADVVYEALQAPSDTRMSMIFSDTIPDYVGFVRSTRLTHARLRQEWDSFFVTSGYSEADVPQEWRDLGVPNPEGRSAEDPGVVFVGDYSNKPWGPYVYRIFSAKGARYEGAITELFNLSGLLNDVAPKDHQAANHTFLFTDEIPANGDSGNIVYVKHGGGDATDSRLEYNAEQNCYFRYVHAGDSGDLPYCTNVLLDPEVKKVSGEGKNAKGFGLVIQGMEPGAPIGFSNVIIQGITMNWRGAKRPDPVLTGKGNADYFMGGKHIAGVWERTDMNSRTVFYDENGEEIKLQRGRTLIILLGYNSSSASASYE